MKLHHDIAHSGTLDAEERIAMTMDMESLPVLQKIFIDLYSDKPLACVREIFTNAWDSQREAGVTDPVEVDLPTPLRPVLVIRDHGVGMTEDFIKNRYSQYGNSSKRDSDEVMGMLGLGCKAPLTYTSQFTVTAIKDGIKVIFLITRNPDGGGAVQKVMSEPTDERNGVEVEIPVSNAGEMHRAAKNFFRFVEPGSVLVDGEPPDHYFDPDVAGMLELDSDVRMIPGLDHDYVIMGQVAYPCDLFGGGEVAGTRDPTARQRSSYSRVQTDDVLPIGESTALSAYKTFTSSVPNRHSLDWHFAYNRPRVVAIVPIGGIDFTPSREALQMTERTKECLEELRGIIRAKTQWRIHDDIDSAPTYAEAMRRALAYRQTFTTQMKFQYRGLQIPNEIRFVPEIKVTKGKPGNYQWTSVEDDGKAWVYQPGKIDSTYSMTHGSAQDLVNTKRVIVYGYTGRGLRAETKERADLWICSRGLAEMTQRNPDYTPEFRWKVDYTEHVQMVFVRDKIASPWFDEIEQIPFDEIKNIEIVSTKAPADLRWRTVDLNGYERKVEGSELVKCENIAYVMAGVRADPNSLAALADLGAAVIIVPERRKAKLRKEFPQALPIDDYIKRAVKEFADTASPELALMMELEWFDLWAHAYQPLSVPSVRRRLLDPELVSLLERLSAARQNVDKAERIVRIAKMFSVDIPDLTAVRAPARRSWGVVKARYPYLSWMMPRREHDIKGYLGGIVQILNNEYIVSQQVHLDWRTY